MPIGEHLCWLSAKAQVTIRDRLGLTPGALVRFSVDNSGTVTLERAAPPLESGCGAVTPFSRPEDFERLREEALAETVELKFGTGKPWDTRIPT